VARKTEILEINMEFSSIAGTPFKVSRIALGTWAIGGWMWGGTDEHESVQTIHAALDRGINLIDTAPVYGFGRSEEIVGKALETPAKARRSQQRYHLDSSASEGLETSLRSFHARKFRLL